MAINSAGLTADMTLALLPGEKVFTSIDGVKLSLESGGGYPGAGGSYYSNKGLVYLTNIRLVYKTKPAQDLLKTVEIPLGNFRQMKLVQPLFGANEITAVVLPIPGHGLSGPAQLTLSFREGGAVEIHSMYLDIMSTMTGQAHRQAPQEALPVYSEQPVNNHQTLMAGQTNAAGEEDPPAYSSQ